MGRVGFSVLFLVLGGARALTFSDKMKGIGEESERTLHQVLERSEPRYTAPDANATYVSDATFNPMGMAHLYNATLTFIEFLQKKDAYPPGFLEVHDGNVELVVDPAQEWKTIQMHYVGISAVVYSGVALAAVLPFAGLCFCCSRCAGNCGGRSQPFDKKHDRCKKYLLATLLICLITLYMLGMVATFVTNDRTKDGVRDLPETARAGLRDTREYLDVTRRHADTLLVANYRQLKTNLIDMLQTGGAKVSDQLAEFSRAVSVTTLNTMVKDLGKVKSNLMDMREVTNDLRTNASQLNDGLRSVKRELLHTLTTCTQKQCQDIQQKYKIGQLDTSGIDFSQLPDVSELLSNVSSLIDGNIQEEVMEGQKVFDNIKRNIESSVNKQIPKLKNAIENAGSDIQHYSSEIENVVGNAQKAINDLQPQIDKAEMYIDEYNLYAWYIRMGTCFALLLVLFCLVMGLLCGVCGKRPDGYSDDCCNKGAGSRCLMLGVAFMFLLGSVLILSTLVYFLVGVITKRVICDSLMNPSEDQFFSLIDRVVNLEERIFKEKTQKDFNMSVVIAACHRNETIYNVLHLSKLIDMEALQNKSAKELVDKINEVNKSISFNKQNYVILKDSARNKLRELSESGLSDFPFDRFTEVLVTNITSIDLLSLAKQLRDTAFKISNKSDFINVTANLRNQALHLESYQHNLVNPMIREVEKLNNTAIQLRDNLKFNHSSFKEAVLSLVEETKEAETYLSIQGPEAIKKLTYIFASSIGTRVSDYLARVTHHTKNEIGRCGPLSNAYNATLTATCSRILLPFNGFWFAAGCCILLFIPLIFVSVKLSTLYQKSDPYPGPLVEAEYLYDAYADRDNIPLANTQHIDKASRRRGDRSDRGERGDRPIAGRSGMRPRSGDCEPRAPALDGGHSSRYNDMAPKHWEDFPAGGPPRYHGPAEYERPPPYYYPGPHNDRS